MSAIIQNDTRMQSEISLVPGELWAFTVRDMAIVTVAEVP